VRFGPMACALSVTSEYRPIRGICRDIGVPPLGCKPFETEDGLIVHHFENGEIANLLREAGTSVVFEKRVEARTVHGRRLPGEIAASRADIGVPPEKYAVLCGGIGVGKTSVAKRVVKHRVGAVRIP